MVMCKRSRGRKLAISDNCRIKFKRKNRRKCSSRNMAVPTGSYAAKEVKDTGKSRLLRWAEQTFGAVTSFSVVEGRAVQFYSGRDSSAGSSCDATSLQTSQRAFTHREVRVPLVGCHSEDMGRIFTVRSFIIELLDRPPPSPGIDGLDVDIEAYKEPNHNTMSSSGQPAVVGRGPLLRELASTKRTGAGKEVEFDLVIKTPSNLKWKLHSRSISRKINIVSNSQDVKTNGIKISEIGFREEVIQDTGQDLVQWTNDFVSTTWVYVGVRGANTFKLHVPPKGHKIGRVSKTGSSPLAPFPGIKTGTGQSDKGESGRGVSREVTPRAGSWDAVDNADQPAWTGVGGGSSGGQGAGQGTSGVSGSSVVSARCYNTTMEVKLLKSFVEIHKLDKARMFLGLPECGMTDETETSIIFKVPLSKCGINAREITTSHKRVHKTDLVIKTPPGLRSQLLMEEVGSGYMKAGNSAGGDTDPELDSEDDIAEPGSGLQDQDLDGMYDDEDFDPPDDLQDHWRHSDQDNITFNVECDEYLDPALPTRTKMKGFKPPPKGTLTKTKAKSPYAPHVSVLVADNSWLEKAIPAVPVEISQKKPVFIRAKLKNKDATLLVDSCWFSKSENPYNRTSLPTYFIKQGCNFGIRGMEWMDDPPAMGAQSTNFRSSQFRLDSSLLQQLLPQESGVAQWFLHCEYRDCQRTDRSKAVQCPVLPEDRCKLYESRSPLTHQTFFWGPLTMGPFVVKSSSPGSGLGSRPTSKNTQWFLNGRNSLGQGKGISGSNRGGVVVGRGAGGGKSTHAVDPHDSQQAAPPQQLIIMEGLDPFLAVGIAFATFVLGIVLVAAIWCIHTRTGEHHSSSSSPHPTSPPSLRCLCPVKSRTAGHVSVEGSGDLTPNSSSPMTA
ncbi:transforming growth factor beta receptor type 3 [Elysia marginata]|uniref:Transforming growth factor beta receptor type 3 n=1 Tax=Elysia marginata TaxID=1093978 RepID=A0AAV4IG06_9GAST|nr:transforming growth factor beta receptor type 3 [Elysia marginata]